MTVLVDSWTWIEYFKGSAAGRRARMAIEDLGSEALVSAINVAEVYRWFLQEEGSRGAEDARFLMTRRSEVVDVTEALAVEAAKLRKERGWGLGDSIVYATARDRNATLLTGDPDFRGAEGVTFIGAGGRR